MPFPLDTIFVDPAAQKLGIRLPISYIVKMQRSNGGDINVAGDDWQLFPIYDDSDKNSIRRTCNDIVRETKLARERACFPSDGVAIASNGGGDLLLFLPNEMGERMSEAIYFWDHQTGESKSVAEAIDVLPN